MLGVSSAIGMGWMQSAVSLRALTQSSSASHLAVSVATPHATGAMPRNADAGASADTAQLAPLRHANPADQALEEKLNNLIPNSWKASAAVVDAFISLQTQAAAIKASAQAATSAASNLSSLPQGGRTTQATQIYVGRNAAAESSAATARAVGSVLDTRA